MFLSVQIANTSKVSNSDDCHVLQTITYSNTRNVFRLLHTDGRWRWRYLLFESLSSVHFWKSENFRFDFFKLKAHTSAPSGFSLDQAADLCIRIANGNLSRLLPFDISQLNSGELFSTNPFANHTHTSSRTTHNVRTA